MKRFLRYSAVAIALSAMLWGQRAWAERNAIILCGAGDKMEYQQQFRDWGTRLDNALVHIMAFKEGSIEWLTEPLEAPMPAGAHEINLDAIKEAFQRVAQRSGADDDLYVFLIGHGSYQNNVSKFIIPGPDMSTEDLGTMLDSVPGRYKVVIDSTSSSAGFINALSGKGRVICSATKNVEERNATDFMEYFLEALEEGSADQDRDERISVLEACQQAATLTEAAYVGEGQISTEHAILDDNGDGLGTRLPVGAEETTTATGKETKIDGAIAATLYLRDFSFPPAAPQELVQAYRGALDEIAALKAKKATMESDAYYAELEKLFIKAAKINRDIRAFGGPPPAAAAKPPDATRTGQ